MSDTTSQVFNSAFRARNRLLASSAIVLASAAPFALALIVITYFVPDPTSWPAAVLTAAAFLAAGTFTWAVQSRFALLGNDWLRKSLSKRILHSEELAKCSGGPDFIGFAPGDDVRTWDGETDLDVGFLGTTNSDLVFVGDRFSWSLAKDRIDRIDLTPPAGPRRVVIHWHAPREPGRSFTIESREGKFLREIDNRTVELFKQLRRWSIVRTGDSDERAVLGYPPADWYGGRPTDQLASGSCSTTLGMMVIIVLTIWYLASEMMKEGYYYHAVLWAGFVFVGGAVFTRCLLHYLQSIAEPTPRRQA